MTQSEVAFSVFLATSGRERMSKEEQRLYDFHKGNKHPGSSPEIEQQIDAYKRRKQGK